MPQPTLRNKLLLALVGAPALLLALTLLVELGFVVAGVDPRQHFFVRATDEQGRALLIRSANLPVARATFRVERFLARPPDGTKRIVCIGDSTCFGHGFDPPVPFANWIEARLAHLLPGIPFEVVNLGASGFDSEEMLDLLTEVDGGGADVLLIYSGHNEFIPQSLAPVVHPIRHAFRRALARTRAGSWLLQRTRRPDPPWETPLNARNEAVCSTPLLTSEEIARGHAHYRAMLDAMVTLGRSRGAAVLLIHPVSDWVDSAVEASVFSAATPAETRNQFLQRLVALRTTRRHLEAARSDGQALDAARIASALKEVDELAALDAEVAAIPYERGRLLLLAGKVAEARAQLLAALESDAAPIRATSAILRIQDEVAERRGALVVDPQPDFDAAAAPGLAGQDGFFIDYCHPDVRGHELLSDAILHRLARANLFAPEIQWRFGSEPTAAEYLKRGGYDAAKQAESWAGRALIRLWTTRFGAGDERAVDAARRLFERAARFDKQCASAWIGLGLIATIRKDPDRAVANFDRAAALKPGALDQIAGPYQTNPAVKQLFDGAGLVFEQGRVVKAH